MSKDSDRLQVSIGDTDLSGPTWPVDRVEGWEPKPGPVPDDIVARIPLGEVELSVYAFDTPVSRITLRCSDEGVPLKIGELVEFEVVAIERRVTER